MLHRILYAQAAMFGQVRDRAFNVRVTYRRIGWQAQDQQVKHTNVDENLELELLEKFTLDKTRQRHVASSKYAVPPLFRVPCKEGQSLPRSDVKHVEARQARLVNHHANIPRVASNRLL